MNDIAISRVQSRSLPVLFGASLLTLAACGEMATLPVSADTGGSPTLPALLHKLIPTVN